MREKGGRELLVVSELVADFVDDLPCSEEKVALDVVGIHCTMGTAGMRRKSNGERRRGRAEGRSYRELFMHATGQIGTQGKREMWASELTDGGVGPLAAQGTNGHRLNLLLSIFQLVPPLPHPQPHISSLVLTTTPSLYSFSHSQWLRRSLNFLHQSRASYL